MAARDALTALLASPKFELIPLKNVHAQAAFLPPGATVSVTASPAKGIEATIELAADLQARGFRAIPHLSARMVHDRRHLRELLDRIEAALVAHMGEAAPFDDVTMLAVRRGTTPG